LGFGRLDDISRGFWSSNGYGLGVCTVITCAMELATFCC